MNIPDTRTGQMDVFLPPAMDLDAAIRLNVTAALARTGEWPATIEYGTGRPHSPGVTSRLVTYTTGVPPATGPTPRTTGGITPERPCAAAAPERY